MLFNHFLVNSSESQKRWHKENLRTASPQPKNASGNSSQKSYVDALSWRRLSISINYNIWIIIWNFFFFREDDGPLGRTRGRGAAPSSSGGRRRSRCCPPRYPSHAAHPQPPASTGFQSAVSSNRVIFGQRSSKIKAEYHLIKKKKSFLPHV